jgi:hypothetical protein
VWGVRKGRDCPYVSKASVIGEGTGCMQLMNFPGSQGTTCRSRTDSQSAEPLLGCLGVWYRRTAMASRISRTTAKSGCAWKWGGWGQVSEDGPGQHNPDRSEDPWGRAAGAARTVVPKRTAFPGTERGVNPVSDGHEERWQTGPTAGKAPPDIPALKPD